MSRRRYSVRVVAKHRSSINPVPWTLIKLNRSNQLTWGVIKFCIAKRLGQFKNKTYTFDIDGVYYDDYANTVKKKFLLDDPILNNSSIIYSLVPIHYKEKIHFIPHNAVDFTLDINEEKIQTEYY